MTQKEHIKRYLESQNEWIVGDSLDNLTTPYGFLSARASRTARQMAEKGEIDRQYWYKNGKKLVFYRAKQPVSHKEYWSEGRLICRVLQYEKNKDRPTN